jgi:hypothetical protein
MTNTQTTKANHYFRALVALAVLTMTASLLAVMAVRPASASTTFTVNYPYDTSDATSADSLCDVATFIPGEQCTLRAAIQQANATPGADAIHFGISDSYGAGVKTIHVGATSPSNGSLPVITDTVTIDGYTQPGSSENTLAKGTNAKLMIQIDGSKLSAMNSCGLWIDAPNVVVKGLVINRATYSVYVMDDASNTKIEGNFIGTAPSGTKAPSGSGTGVALADYAGPANNTVGGWTPAARNLISGNLSYGVLLHHSNYNAVWGNLIGTQRDGKSPLGNGNSGVYVDSGSNNVVGGPSGNANTIAFNNHDGVKILNGVGNNILSNSVFSNHLLGINLTGGTESASGATANDKGDADNGSNHLQNYPVLSSAKRTATGKTVVKGNLNSNPGQTFYVQFFSNPKGTNEGQKLLGTKSVPTDGAGNVSFAFATMKKVSLGQSITATVTSSTTEDTSEFSAPRKVVAP